MHPSLGQSRFAALPSFSLGTPPGDLLAQRR